jgi:glycosyltransferase involved in cell wall biosynthesis
LLVGDGPLKARIMKLAYDLDLLDRVVFFAGPLSRDEVAEVLGKASIFVFPSLKEGLPLSVLEAMACGVPTVGSDISGVNDLVEDGVNGLLVPPANSPLFAEAILGLLDNNRLRSRMSVNTRRTIVEEYSWDRVLQKLDDIYLATK